METIRIQTESKNYDVYVGEGVTSEIDSFITNHFKDLTKILLITDETVASLHLEKILYFLQAWNPVVFTAPSGEKAKTFDIYYQALTVALENGLDRKSAILSFGGGAVGDLSGFVASSFMRGIPFFQVPTTILAHDSAVGGKVAINHPLGKNMVGAFHQPEAVFYDLDYLKTLPLKEVRSGFAEVIKHALINDSDFYEWLQSNITDLELVSTEQLSTLLARGIRIKGEYVSKDEREMGIRAYLNFGHTLGHAIESEMGYGNFTHGEAVMIGMVFALKLSQDLQGLSFDVNQFENWVQSLGFLTRVPANLSIDRLLDKMKQDKKTISHSIRFVLLEQLGKPQLLEVSDEILLEKLKRFF
jgi:3-dehydroquinate synthase